MLNILYEDNHLLAINKEAGIPVQPDQTGDECLLDLAKAYIKHKYKKPGEVFLGLAHRLDRPVSGVVLMAKTSKALSRVNEMFKNRTIDKTYWAISKNRPNNEAGRLENWMVKDAESFKARIFEKEKKGAKKAILEYTLVSKIADKHLFEVKLYTGRHHQIRAQMAHMGCIIVGDQKYGSIKGNRDRSICLHAKSLAFVHPVKKEPIRIDAKVPDTQFWNDFRSYGK